MSQPARVAPLLAGSKPGARAHILVVDDSAASRAYVNAALEAMPALEVSGVASAAEALRALQQGGYSLVLCDYEMPDMSGLQLLRLIRQQYSPLELPVLMLTGRDEPQVKVRAFRAGANDYISKQAEPEELLARVGTQIELMEAHRRLLEARLRRAESQKFEAVGHLSEAFAHELNTPAQYITDNLSFLSESFASLKKLLTTLQEQTGPLAPAELQALLAECECDYALAEVPRCIEESQQGIAQMSRVVAVMREFAQRGADEATLHDLNEIIRGATAVTRGQWNQVAQLELELDEHLPHVVCVGALIKQVVLYAIMNAIKALTAKGGMQRSRGQLSIRSQTLNEDWVAIEISDNAQTLCSDTATKLLDPLLSAAQPGDAAQALAHIRSVIVDEHGGELEIQSEPGGGTRLRMRLPRKRAQRQ
jgi:DNA-binding response OmpR family regulator